MSDQERDSVARLQETPERAVLHGKAQFGRFGRPFRDLNLLEADCGIPRLFGMRRFRLKQWVHIAVVHDDWYLSLALVDLGFLGTSWLHLFNRRSGHAFEHTLKLPPGRFRAPANLWDHSGTIETRGYRVRAHDCLDQQVHHFEIDIKAKGSLPAISGSVTLYEDPARTQPLAVLLPLGPNRPMFSHKSACPVGGLLDIAGAKVEFTPDRHVGLLDYHKAFYPRSTFWKWATFAIIDGSGNLLGCNLTHNVIRDDTQFNENCIWHGNRLTLLGAARFDIPKDRTQPWRIRTEDGRADLQLIPQGRRSERVNLGLVKSAYDQPYGLYSGTLIDGEGVSHRVENAFGLAEDHVSLW
ncbi:MAG: DUF2804 domain-containing protein [Dehalococcoidia bacterium]|nr:DUF2804 domain-containing protein [Dehalococcoidia bacterium]